jgi:hypothetical protein
MLNLVAHLKAPSASSPLSGRGRHEPAGKIDQVGRKWTRERTKPGVLCCDAQRHFLLLRFNPGNEN